MVHYCCKPTDFRLQIDVYLSTILKVNNKTNLVTPSYPKPSVTVSNGSAHTCQHKEREFCTQCELLRTCMQLTLKYNNGNVEKMLCKLAYIKH